MGTRQPRRRLAAAPVPPHSGNLPDDLLLSILGCLDLNTRLSVAALVCKRWYQLTQAPQLLAVVEARLPGDVDRFAEQMPDFCRWLQRHAAPHLRRLRVVSPMDVQDVEESQATAADDAAAELWDAVLDAGRTPGCQLYDLRLELGLPERTTMQLPRRLLAWEEGVGRTLRRLHVHKELGATETSRSGPLGRLSKLEDLTLSSCSYVGMGLTDGAPTAALLPTALTRLQLLNVDGEVLPPNMGALTRLHSLNLDMTHVLPGSFDPLTRLQRLRRLRLEWCKHLPACLSRLTGLTALCVEWSSVGMVPLTRERMGVLEPALRPLTALRHLALTLCPPPDAVCCLPLRTLCCLPCREGSMADPAVVLPCLPLGPCSLGAWLYTLRHLVLPARLAGASLDVLEAAPQLERLSLFAFGGLLITEQQRLLDACVAHPVLSRLDVELAGPYVTETCILSLGDAVRRKPGLRLAANTANQLRQELWEVGERGPDGPGFEPWTLPFSML